MSAAAQIEIQSLETWARLESSPQWAALTDSQRVWVTQFLATGSALLATKAGYRAKSEQNSRVLSYELAKNKTIVAALEVAAGKVKTEREILIETVREQLRASEKGSIAASKFTAQLERLQLGVKPEAEDDPEAEVSQPNADASPTPRSKVGDIVLVEGIKHRVTAVDANGRATDGEPL